jgi:hypothetical protein
MCVKVRNIRFIALEVFCHLGMVREEKTLAGVLVSALSGCSDSSEETKPKKKLHLVNQVFIEV